MLYHNVMVYLFLLSSALVCYGQKTPKQFSLFSIVSFKQEECEVVSTKALKGVCMTNTECQSSGGTADGNCAAAFGVCCLKTLSACGGSVTQNCTYIDNPGYPSSYSTTGDCSYTVTRCQDDICQIRLDFFSSTLQQPSSATPFGVCTNTILDITGGTTSGSVTNNPPNLCGTLTGQHVYIDSGRAATAATLKFTLASSASNTWRIKVTQIECWNPSKAPEDCLQYFYGEHMHTVTSFNWDGSAACGTGCMLNDQMYTTCFRPEKGMCSSAITETTVSSSLESFGLDGEADAMEDSESTVTCAAEDQIYLLIHTPAAGNRDTFCGEHLSQSDEATSGGVVYTSPSNGFSFITVADEDLAAAAVAGYSLDVTQISCGPHTFGGAGNQARGAQT